MGDDSTDKGQGPISVVVPAFNEEHVIERCLRGLLDGAKPGEVEVVVACNGCSDRTVELARAFGEPVRVVETRVASKIAALNLGDAAATGFPRFYVDADVVLRIEDVRAVARVLACGDVLAAAPSMEMVLDDASWPVRAYYRVWSMLPYMREGMIGVGSYALSVEGRERFGEFPDVIADDGYVRMLFTADERAEVAHARSRVTAPRRLSDLLEIKTRSRLGGYQLRQRFPDIVRRERAGKSYRGAVWSVVTRPWLWPHAVAYLYVNLVTRRRARRQFDSGTTYTWARDENSRQAAAGVTGADARSRDLAGVSTRPAKPWTRD